HLLVYPMHDPEDIGPFLHFVKGSVARKAINYLRKHAPTWLPRLEVREGEVVRHRFWQPGGGYDRNVEQTRTLRAMIEYIHANPVRRGLVARPEDWEWSSARWFLGLEAVVRMDERVLVELANESLSRSER